MISRQRTQRSQREELGPPQRQGFMFACRVKLLAGDNSMYPVFYVFFAFFRGHPNRVFETGIAND
jgi:hypothetical protein